VLPDCSENTLQKPKETNKTGKKQSDLCEGVILTEGWLRH